MIRTHLSKNESINNTLIVFFNDNPNPSLMGIKYDCLNLFDPKPNPWFFYHIEDYLTEIKKFRKQYANVLLLGGSKGGSASIVISSLLKKEQVFKNVLCWAMSPVLEINYGKTIKAEKIFISTLWEEIKNDENIKSIVDQYGKVYSYIDCSIPLLYSYSYSYDHKWIFDKKQFDLIQNKNCIIEDYLLCNKKLIKFDPKKPPYANIHNTLGYYWKADRDLFYFKLSELIFKHT